MTDQPIIDLLSDIVAVLDADEAALNAEQTALQAELAVLQTQVSDIQSQLGANTEKLADSARFRALVSSIQDGSAPGSMVVPGSAALPPSDNPISSGITEG